MSLCWSNTIKQIDNKLYNSSENTTQRKDNDSNIHPSSFGSRGSIATTIATTSNDAFLLFFWRDLDTSSQYLTSQSSYTFEEWGLGNQNINISVEILSTGIWMQKKKPSVFSTDNVRNFKVTRHGNRKGFYHHSCETNPSCTVDQCSHMYI